MYVHSIYIYIYVELKRKARDEKQNDCLMPEIILHAFIG